VKSAPSIGLDFAPVVGPETTEPSQDLAARARVSLGTLYSQFPSKEELLLAVMEDDARHGVELIRDGVARDGNARTVPRAPATDLLALLLRW
jgi:AcrR family transcriptional regulator